MCAYIVAPWSSLKSTPFLHYSYPLAPAYYVLYTDLLAYIAKIGSTKPMCSWLKSLLLCSCNEAIG